VTHTADGKGRLCTKHWIHAYTDPILAVLMNPIHGKYDTYTGHMWECEGEIGRRNGDRKVGCKKLTTIKRIDMPRITIEQRIRFAILCAKKVCKDRKWNKWANGWLSRKDRTADAARAAHTAAAVDTTYATCAATYTIDAAAAVDATSIAYAAAYAVAYAVDAANINLIEIAHEAVKAEGERNDTCSCQLA